MSPHYYDRLTGFLYDVVPNKSKPGEYRDFSLKDARLVKALPSVTNILAMLSKPGLVEWQIRQGIKAAANYILEPDHILDIEDENEVLRRSKDYVNYTAEYGTSVHWWLNHKLQAVEVTELPPIIPGAEEVADGLLEWFPVNGFEWTHTEKRFADVQLGVAGTVDLLGSRHGKPAIGDAKTQEPPLTPYLEHGLQLAGYSLGLGLAPDVERWSFITNRACPGEVKAHLWLDKGSTIERTNARYDKIWLGLVELWMGINQYDPREVA